MTAALSMRDLVEQYLGDRRRLGFALRIEGQQLRAFARFADAAGHVGPLTIDLAVRWATAPTPRGRQFPGRRLEVLRPFARACAARDGVSAVPARLLLGPSHRRPVPHLYTAAQVRALLRQARQLAPAGGLRPWTYATLFGLLAATGLRVSEALRVERRDVDVAEGTLVVRATKFRKSRLVPLHPTVAAALRRYALVRDRLVAHPTAVTFFVGVGGGAVPYATVRTTFGRLRRALGWAALVPRPRIHDMRHTFVCRRLRDWYAEGVEVAPRLAALATYLGHAHLSDTYWYLTGAPDLLALVAHRFETFAAGAHPGDPS